MKTLKRQLYYGNKRKKERERERERGLWVHHWVVKGMWELKWGFWCVPLHKMHDCERLVTQGARAELDM